MHAYAKLAASIIAIGLASPALAAQSTTALPQPKTEGAITYMSGGIGKDQALAMKKEEKHYPLSMVFSEGKHDEYVADIGVTVKDSSGKVVLHTTSGGPIMLVKLPPGNYTVVADMGGKTQRRSAKVAAKGDTNLSFHWSHA
jgi:hypothetical protein